MVMCNMFTGGGLSWSIMGTFSMAWLGIVILVFIFMFSRRWIFEEALSSGFNLWFAITGSAVSYVAMIAFTCSPRWAFVVGLLVGYVVGYFTSEMVGGGTG